MNINDLANNLGKDIVKDLLGEIKVNNPNPNMNWEQIIEYIRDNELNDSKTHSEYLKSLRRVGYEINSPKILSDILKNLPQNKLNQLYRDLQQIVKQKEVNEIKVNKPNAFPKNEDWIYVAKNEDQYNKAILTLKSQGWLGIPNEFTESAYPVFIMGYIDKNDKSKYTTSFMFNRHFGKILNPEDLPEDYLNEIKINNPVKPKVYKYRSSPFIKLGNKTIYGEGAEKGVVFNNDSSIKAQYWGDILNYFKDRIYTDDNLERLKNNFIYIPYENVQLITNKKLDEIKINNPAQLSDKEVDQIYEKYPEIEDLYYEPKKQIGYNKNTEEVTYKITLPNQEIYRLVASPLKGDKWYPYSVKEDKIPGGLSQGKSLEDIAKHHIEKGNYRGGIRRLIIGLEKQLEKGIKVELEHTSDKSIAKEIAMDHLFEDPKYYDKLEKIETNEIRINTPLTADVRNQLLRLIKNYQDDEGLDNEVYAPFKERINNARSKEELKTILDDFFKQEKDLSDEYLEKAFSGEIDEIKVNNPNITPETILDYLDKLEDISEGGMKIWNEIYDIIEEPEFYGERVNNLETTLNYLYEKGKLNQLWGKIQSLKEIKVNNPSVTQFPILINSDEELKTNIERLKKNGFHIHTLDSDFTRKLNFPTFLYGDSNFFMFLSDDDNEGKKYILKNKEIKENKLNFIDKLLTEFNKGVDEIKINNPLEPKFPIKINNKEEYIRIANILDKQGYFNAFRSSLLKTPPLHYPVYLNPDPISKDLIFFRGSLKEIKINKPNAKIDWDYKYMPLENEDGYRSYTARGIDENGKEWLGTSYFYGGEFEKIEDIEPLNESQNIKQSNPKPYLKYLDEILEYCCKDLNIDRPKVVIVGEKYIQENTSFGGYQPGENKIYLVIKNRVCSDSGRSLSHEIYHAYQDAKGVLTPESGKDGSVHENEANSYSGKTMRHFNKTYPEILTLTMDKDYSEENKIRSEKLREEYTQYALKELFEKDLPNIKKLNSVEYLVGNGKDIEAKYRFRKDEPENDKWSMHWDFTENNKNKSSEAWKQVTSTSYKVLKQFIDDKKPKFISISGNTPKKTNLYKSNSYLEKIKNIFNNQYSIDNNDSDFVLMKSIEEACKNGIISRIETLNESYDKALNYWQNLDINAVSKIGRWDAIKRKVKREVLWEIYNIK